MSTLLPAGPIRVAHILNYLAPAGKELGILKLMRHLSPDVFQSSLIVTNEVRQRDELDLQGINIVELGFGAGNQPLMPLAIRTALISTRAEIAHTHSWGTLLEGVIGARLARTPVHIHGEHGSFPNGKIHRRLQNLFWRNARQVLSVSRPLLREMASTTGFPAERIKVVLNGVDEKQFYASDEERRICRERHGLSDRDFVVGTVGRLNAVKNQSMLIRSIAALRDIGQDVHAMIVGSVTVGTDNGPRLRRLAAELDIENRIHFVEFQSDVNAYYNAFDIFALTSISEGCSNVLQEAMFCGRPVIATNVGGNPDLIRDCEDGLLVKLNDCDELALRIAELKCNPERRLSLARAAAEKSRMQFSLSAMVRAYERIYLEEYYRQFSVRNAPAKDLQAIAELVSARQAVI